MPCTRTLFKYHAGWRRDQRSREQTTCETKTTEELWLDPQNRKLTKMVDECSQPNRERTGFTAGSRNFISCYKSSDDA